MLPGFFFEILFRLSAVYGRPEENLDMIENFCGVAELMQAFSSAGLVVWRYDLGFDSVLHDMCSESGSHHDLNACES